MCRCALLFVILLKYLVYTHVNKAGLNTTTEYLSITADSKSIASSSTGGQLSFDLRCGLWRERGS